MVDFRKRLAKHTTGLATDPIALYDTLDRASDKGPLRPAQEAILREWHTSYRQEQDVILKLHTGQGKTLVGLLILQCKLNEGRGPALYLCPNRFLINQTCDQAQQFGLSYCTAEDDLPVDFADCKSILVTSIQKLFNGLTKFGLGPRSMQVGSIVIDDAHACVDAIREAFVIRIKRDENAYSLIRDLFAGELQNQGMGTFWDIKNQDYNALLPVPYWAWQERHEEIATILSKNSASDSIKYAWPLIRDRLDKCQCVVSGGAIEIVPYLPALNLFGSYANASHRVYMSATVANDSFLIKGLGLPPKTIQQPLVYKKEKWSGEKMILIPSLIHESLDREALVKRAATTKEQRRQGVVALVPSFKAAGQWQAYGATMATKSNIDAEIEKLKAGHRERTLVVANRYDGIDLPDDSCRLLVFDSEPYSESLIDLYAESCRRSSEATAIRKARTIEQGLGRSVRGEKDYSVIIITGPDLVRCVRSRHSQKYLSNQTRAQIQIGLDIAEMARDELAEGSDPFDALNNVMAQCFKRDASWKAFYAEQMESVEPEAPSGAGVELFAKELEAEKLYERGDPRRAVEILQGLVDEHVKDEEDRGWYLQEMARYMHACDAPESNRLQLHAHLKNHALMKPRSGMQITKITVVSPKRMEKIISWVSGHKTFEEVRLAADDVLSRLAFGVKADKFEDAFNELAKILGFLSQRPDKEWKEGPDNLWGVRDGQFLLVECKSEVDLTRAEINEKEVEQMNRSCAWFEKTYKGANAKNVLIIPTRKLAKSTTFIHPVEIMREKTLSKLVRNVRAFIGEFKALDLRDLSEVKVQELVDVHGLSVDALMGEYTESARP